ncbi:heterokaryon incompatibility protein-domain-containing protein [Lenzites betulinus]|nr:heterokaryon incompatibility protein-domain-containing protein [Lenzites betulinus]
MNMPPPAELNDSGSGFDPAPVSTPVQHTDVADRDGSVSPLTPRPPYARPRHLVVNGELVPCEQDPDVPAPYIAVSYTWDIDTIRECKWGREVSKQALDIVKTLSCWTTLPLWIDAICIPQNDDAAKEEELPRMADIYRGAVEVWCLVDSVDRGVDEAFSIFAKLFEDDKIKEDIQEGAGRMRLSQNMPEDHQDDVERVFGHRWWERAWTFQEATVNPRTFLVGRDGHRLPISTVLTVARFAQSSPPIASDYKRERYGRGGIFWDSVVAMTLATQYSLSLGEGIACVWRRNATREHDQVYSLLGVVGLLGKVTPSYHEPFRVALRSLFQAAAISGDFSWIPWCSDISHADGSPAERLIPTPDDIKNARFTVHTGWTNAKDLPVFADYGTSQRGMMLPLRDYGLVDSISQPLTLEEMVAALRWERWSSDEIWDVLFGMIAGLRADHKAHAELMLQSALLDIAAQGEPVDIDEYEREGALIPENVLAWTRLAFICPKVCFYQKPKHLLIVSCPIGEFVVRAEHVSSGREGARVFALPVETIKKSGRSARDFVFVSESGDLPARACATGLLVRRPTISVDMPWQITEVV